MVSASILDSALRYAQSYGWAVHPVNLKKKPTTEHGRDDVTHDEATIRQYFQNGVQLAVATGPERGLFVFDVDLDTEKDVNGYETLAYLEGRYGPPPRTPHQRTGRGAMRSNTMKQKPSRPAGSTPPLTDRHQPHPRAVSGNAASHPAEVNRAALVKQMPRKIRER